MKGKKKKGLKRLEIFKRKLEIINSKNWETRKE